MANTVDRNKQLRKTYDSVNVASVRRFDRARKVGPRNWLPQNKRAQKKCHTRVPYDTLEDWWMMGDEAKILKNHRNDGARDGTRTRDLRRDRAAL
jgi:hypothetical protein